MDRPEVGVLLPVRDADDISYPDRLARQAAVPAILLRWRDRADRLTQIDRPVVAPSALGHFVQPMVIAAVPVPTARPAIRRRLTRMGLVECADYWVCA